MSSRAIITVLLATACGFAAVIGIQQFRTPKETVEAPKSSQVVVAVNRIASNRIIEEKDLKVTDWPADNLPAGSFSEIKKVAGRVSKGVFYPGAPVLDVGLAPEGARPGLDGLIPAGMRAHTIQASRAGASIGFIQPGSKVDILVTMRDSTNADSGGGSTSTLLEAVEILAVDEKVDMPADGRIDSKGTSTVTLLVTPQQVKKLELAQNLGTLSLSLRNPNDTEGVLGGAVTADEIRFRAEKPAPETIDNKTDPFGSMVGARDATEPKPPAKPLTKPEPVTPPGPKTPPQGVARTTASPYDLDVSEIVTFRGSSRGQLWVNASASEKSEK